MIKEKHILYKEDEYFYPNAAGFIPNVMGYIHDEDAEQRPCVIIVPGGAYCVVSPTEGEIVAMEFYDKGYNAFVCTYTTNYFRDCPLKLQPLNDLSRAVRFIRKNAADFHIDEEKIVVCGFSAGGHLTASLSVHHQDIKDGRKEFATISNKPDAVILSYPVITSGKYSHKDSFIALFGQEPTEAELEYMSLESHVTKDTPPCFIWQTLNDTTVPVENSYLFAQSCKENHVKFAHHVFSTGDHGLSVANEAWAKGNYGDFYPIEQLVKLAESMHDTGKSIPKELSSLTTISKEKVIELNKNNLPNKEVSAWPGLADVWLQIVLSEQNS